MAAPYILAKTAQDAHAYARNELGLAKGHYRVVTSPSSISGRRGTELYILPGWERRHDRFAMASALKYTRLVIVNVAESVLGDGIIDNLEPAGVQLTLVTSEEANAFILADQPEQEGDIKRRRRRCTECGVLVEPDEVEQHAAEHLAGE